MNRLPLNYKLKNKYRIIKHIAESNFSNIYMVLYNNRKYIVKECFPVNIVIRDENNKVFTEKNKNKFEMVKNDFRKEAELIRKFNDENIVKLIDYFKENNTEYMLLEYCKGSSLKRYILENELTEEEILGIFLKIIKALKKIHGKNVLHRDLKPSNIIVDVNNNIKIIDFGSGKKLSEENRGCLKWTPGYSPLEMYSQKAETDKRTDVYSLCALLYFMLNKSRPMDSLERFYYPELMYKDYVSEKIRRVIEKGMNMERSNRYGDIEELEKDLIN